MLMKQASKASRPFKCSQYLQPVSVSVSVFEHEELSVSGCERCRPLYRPVQCRLLLLHHFIESSAGSDNHVLVWRRPKRHKNISWIITRPRFSILMISSINHTHIHTHTLSRCCTSVILLPTGLCVSPSLCVSYSHCLYIGDMKD